MDSNCLILNGLISSRLIFGTDETGENVSFSSTLLHANKVVTIETNMTVTNLISLQKRKKLVDKFESHPKEFQLVYCDRHPEHKP